MLAPPPTLGGAQLWTDVCFREGWRIQRRAPWGLWGFGARAGVARGEVCRLLSPAHRRHAVGTFAHCARALEKRCPRRDDEPADTRELVVLLHGLGRTSRSMQPLRKAMQDTGFATAALDYASTRDDVSAHAEALDGLLERMAPHPRVSFVTHSLGGIVTRALLARNGDWQRRMPPHRVVMLAPPSRGASLAKRLDQAAFRAVFGASGARMAGAASGAASMPPPPPPNVPFGIIAGSLRQGRGINPLIEGDDDGVVSVEETRLEGAAEHLTLPVLHAVIMRDPDVIRRSVRFVQTGSFETRTAAET